jgi:hypothetical protein
MVSSDKIFLFSVDRWGHIFKIMTNGRKALRMTKKEVPAGLKKFPKTIYKLLLGLPVKIDHDISTKDNMKKTFHGPGFYQVNPAYADHRPYFIFNLVKRR